MAIVGNILYFIMLLVTGVSSFFLISRGVPHIGNPHMPRKNEPYILILTGVLLILGIIFTIYKMSNNGKALASCGWLGLTWIISLVVFFVGIFFFNGPLRWN